MIYAVGQGNRKEMLLVEDELREQTAFRTDEQLNYIGLYTREEFETFIAEDSLADIICADITVLNGIGQVEELRKKYPKVAIVLIADMTISPVTYMKPSILAAALLLKPLQKSMMTQVFSEIFECYIQKDNDEEVLVIENRDEKKRIPYSQILYFEARSKKIYVCTQNFEYGFYDTIDHLEEQHSERFIRCHRSFLVNRKMIEQVKLSQNYLLLNGGIEIPLSRSYKSQIKEQYS